MGGMGSQDDKVVLFLTSCHDTLRRFSQTEVKIEVPVIIICKRREPREAGLTG